MKKLTTEETRKKQLEMLDYIDDLCNKNHLHYYLAYGTLIGAIRHKGYIPWDDDIDIWLLREDYDAFKKLVENDNRYQFIDSESHNEFRFEFAKLVDDKIILFEKGAKVQSPGLFIDIFPLDSFGDTEKEVKKNLKIVSRKKRSIIYYNFPLKALNGPLIKRYIKFHVVVFYKFLLLFRNPVKLIQKYQQYLRDLSKKYKLYVGYFGSPYQNVNKYIYQREDFLETKGIFEGKEYSIPVNYDKILRKLYGDYMKIPPESERINHGIVAYQKEE